MVEIARYGPRISDGASGLGSHMSMWLGPPESQNRMTAFLSPPFGVAAVADSFNVSARLSPARPVKPVCKNQRRDPTRIKSPAGGSIGLARMPLRWAKSCDIDFGEPDMG